jgi:DNA-binding GntR family transcriptional regulator
MTNARSTKISLADHAYDVIRHAILRCELGPGQRLTESQLCSEFGLNRAAVRTALTRLCHDQLVQSIPRHGYAVAPITFTHIYDLFGVRQIIEPAAAKIAATRVDARLLAELEQLNRDCRHTNEQDDAMQLRRANREFHIAVARNSGNERLVEMSRIVLEELDRVLYLPRLANVWERIDSTYDEHEEIIAAIRARDPDRAEQAAIEHILPNMRFVVDVLISSPGLRTMNLVGV